MSDVPAKHVEELFDAVLKAEHEFVDGLPPVEQWQPELNGNLDMRIDREGRWHYQGDEIKREKIVKLFSTILKREGDDFYLVTPIEKWRIQVDAAPFVFVRLEIKLEQQNGIETQRVLLTTNTGHTISIRNPEHPFWMENTGREELPMCMVYRNLPGLLARSVFYELADNAVASINEDGKEEYYFESEGERFSLGVIE